MKFRRILGFLNKELNQIFRNPNMLRLLLVVPLIQIALFGLALSNESKNIRIAFFYVPSNHEMRFLQEHILASGLFNHVNPSTETPYELVRSGKAEVVLVSEPNSIKTQVLINAINTTRATSIESYIQSIQMMSTTNENKIRRPLQFVTRVLYNPQSTTSFFIIPGLLGTMICMITVLVTAMSIVREKEIGTFETIISAPVTKTEILLGKSLPMILMGLFNLTSILLLGILLFELPFRGLLGAFLLVGAIYVVCTVSIGVLISSLCSTQQQAMMASFLFIFPSMMLSGLMFPVENMPDWMIVLSEINPMTHFIYVMRNLVLKGGNWEVIIYRSSIILGMAIISSFLAYRSFKTRLN